MEHKAGSRSSETSERVKDYLLAAGLTPGDPLPSETEFAAQLGVSRPALREALRHLQALDIISVRRGAGSNVGRLSLAPLVEALAFRALMISGTEHQTLREVVQLRQLLDVGLAETLCARLAGTSQPRLAQLVDQMVHHAKAGGVFLEADYAFHDGLLRMAGNEIVRQLVASLWRVHMVTIPKLQLPTATDLVATAAAHGAILQAATAGDVPGYIAAVEAHYQPLFDILDDPRS